MQEALTSAVTQASVGLLTPAPLRHMSQQLLLLLLQGGFVLRHVIIALHGVSRDIPFSVQALHAAAGGNA
jgi:hypothetical protein